MEISSFTIGLEFRSGDRTFRCTDVGTRTIIAIRVDAVEKRSFDTLTGKSSVETISRAQAESEGWFTGPPYSVAEFVFDEYDLEGCAPATIEANGRSW